MELACAGMSGGSPVAVEEEWTMPLYRGWLDHCEKWGPPTYVTVAALMGVLGGKRKKRAGAAPAPKGRRGLPPPPSRPEDDEVSDGVAVPVGKDPEGFMRQFLAAGGQQR